MRRERAILDAAPPAPRRRRAVGRMRLASGPAPVPEAGVPDDGRGPRPRDDRRRSWSRASSTTARPAARASFRTRRGRSTSCCTGWCSTTWSTSRTLGPVFEEAARLLRPGGALVAVEPGLWHPVGLGLAMANRRGPRPGHPRHARRHPALTARADARGARRRARAGAPRGHLRLAAPSRAGAARAPRARLRGLAPAPRAARPHADDDRPWLAATTTRSGTSSRRTLVRRPSTCARSCARLGRVGSALDLGCGDGRLTSGARRRGAHRGRRLARGARPRARAAPRRAPRGAASPTPRCRSTTAPSTSCSAPRPSSTCATSSYCCRRSAGCSRPGGTLALTTPANLPVGRRPHPLSPHLRFFTRRFLAKLLGELGFDVVSLDRRARTLLVRATR